MPGLSLHALSDVHDAMHKLMKKAAGTHGSGSGQQDSGRADIPVRRQCAVAYRAGEVAIPDDVELTAGRAAAEDNLVREVAGVRQAGAVQRRVWERRFPRIRSSGLPCLRYTRND
jgi:hypothetical protein